MITVQEYFEDKLKTKLQFPDLPCVWVGSRDKKNYVPMEVIDNFYQIMNFNQLIARNSCVLYPEAKSTVGN